MGIPSSLRAGDSWSWTESVSDYPADVGWTLVYSLLPVAGSGTKLSISASASGADYAVAIDAATTAGYAAGTYTCSGRVSLAGEAHTIDTLPATVTVLPDLAAQTTYDARSTATKALAKIDAWLSGDKSFEVASYVIADRQIQNHPLPDLMALRSELRVEVQRETATAAGYDGRKYFVRMGRG
jgi:hypothetical protein